jgi:hypothetical protein
MPVEELGWPGVPTGFRVGQREDSRRERSMMKKSGWVVLLAALALLVPATAGAHTLTLSKAARVAKVTAQRFADDEYQFTPDDLVSDVYASSRHCTRISRHRVHCEVLWEYTATDGRSADCIARVTVAYRSRTSHRTRSRVTNDDCFV